MARQTPFNTGFISNFAWYWSDVFQELKIGKPINKMVSSNHKDCQLFPPFSIACPTLF